MPISFTFPKDVAGLAGVFRSVRQGADFVLPTMDAGSLPRQLTGAAMAAAATFSEAWQDRMDDAYVTRLRAMVLTDQSGTLTLESSPDQSAVTTLLSVSIAANVAQDTGWWNLTPGHRWYRRKYVNGATSQGLFLLWGSQEVARGDEAGPVRGNLTDRSGTLTTGSTSQLLAAANPQRRYLLIQNPHATEDLWINFTTAAALGQPSIRLPALTLPMVFENFVSTEVVNVNAVTAGHPYIAKEG
jgi:hypothetical protein